MSPGDMVAMNVNTGDLSGLITLTAGPIELLDVTVLF